MKLPLGGGGANGDPLDHGTTYEKNAVELKDRAVIVYGAGQSPGRGIGNGRAAVFRYLEEGAHVLAVDRDLQAAEETAALGEHYPGICIPWQADVASEVSLIDATNGAIQQFGRIDVLHYNVGISVAGGDASVTQITEEAFDQINAVNLRGAIMAVKHSLPVMREQGRGVITTIASISSKQRYPWVAYKTSKAGLVAFTQQLAIENAQYGIRANTILPGLMDTPMAVDTRARTFNRTRESIVEERDAKVPLRGKMGTGWDVGNAAAFLASDRADFITGVELPVDGGALLNIVR